MTAGLTLGPQPQGAITGTAMKTNGETASSEKKRYNSAITENDKNGNIWWGFQIDDVNLQKWGIDTREDVLPAVHFNFVGDSKVPAPPPKFMDIAIMSYWSMGPLSELKKTWFHKFLHSFKFRSTAGGDSGHRDNTPTTFYSNLFQIVVLKADLSNLPEPSYYRARVKVRSGASGPPEVKRQAEDSLNVTPAVVHGKYITLLTSQVGLEFDETNISRSAETKRLLRSPNNCKVETLRQLHPNLGNVRSQY